MMLDSRRTSRIGGAVLVAWLATMSAVGPVELASGDQGGEKEAPVEVATTPVEPRWSGEPARWLGSSHTAIRPTNGFTMLRLDGTDDGWASAALPFPVGFGLFQWSSLFVNNNGNVSFLFPAAAHTPGPFVGSGLPVIAPFWADVDTRAGGSVTYGSGQIDGRPAFVVNWTDVGYYARHVDKTNTFQLVLIGRSELGNGAIDVEFNYGRIEWETGDNSGGSGGFGGWSARAGFAGGLTGFLLAEELPGSGFQGQFLDSHPNGLARRAGDPPGRMRFEIRDGWLTVGIRGGERFVALGDSYSAGEAVGSYDPGTDVTAINECHRSAQAYGRLFATDPAVAPVVGVPVFRACSGALSSHLYGLADPSGYGFGSTTQWTEPVQVKDRSGRYLLGTNTEVITLSIGGNDVGFPTTIASCAIAGDVSAWARDLATDKTIAKIREFYPRLWERLTRDAPNADIYVLGYPQFFPDSGGVEACLPYGTSELPASSVVPGTFSRAIQDWINKKTQKVNDAIRESTARYSSQVHYVDVENAFDRHHLCEAGVEAYMNGVSWPLVHSFHPTENGQRAFAAALKDRWRNRRAGWLDLASNRTIAVAPIGSAASATFTLAFRQPPVATAGRPARAGANAATAAATPAGIELVSPSGVVYPTSTRAPGVIVQFGNDTVLYTVTDPEPGAWVFRVPATHGVEARAAVVTEAPANHTPTIEIGPNSIRLRAAPYVVNLTAAVVDQDPGDTSTVKWSNTAGPSATGATYAHTFAGPGRYEIVATVTDSSGAIGIDNVEILVGEGFAPIPNPVRLLDTRAPGGRTIDGQHAATGAVRAGTVYELEVAGRAGVPLGASSVVLNVTAVGPTASGYVTVFPCGHDRPDASNLNYAAGDIIPNTVIAGLGTGGRVCFYTYATADLLVDISGYFPDANAFTSLATPARLLDTRNPGGRTADGQHAATGAVRAGTVYELPVAGRAGVPLATASVVLNVTAVGPTAPGYVAVFPCGQDRPDASNLNYAAGDIIPNAVIARLGIGGHVCLYTYADTDLLVDVAGYFPDFATLAPRPAPARLLDTRTPGGRTTDGQHAATGPVGAGTVYELPIAGRADTPEWATSAVLNVTAVGPAGPGYVTVFPCGTAPPDASNLNYTAGDTIPNAVIARLGTNGKVCLFSYATSHLLVDITGYLR